VAAFYKTPFVGNAATDLVDYLKFLEVEIQMRRVIPYAKAFPVVQASGTGKSRMLTEVCSAFVLVYVLCYKFVLDWSTYIHTSDLPSQRE
jgi:hypothetical protein